MGLHVTPNNFDSWRNDIGYAQFKLAFLTEENYLKMGT